MLTKTPEPTLRFPFPDAPAPGAVIEIAPGLLWARLALPFRLDHVNVYLIEDGAGWAIVDTGISNDATRAAWEALIEGPLAGKPVTRVIVTHFHPDHIGLAGWLCDRFDAPLVTSQTSYLACLNISLSPGALDAPTYRDFYLRHGLGAETTAKVATHGHGYLKMVTPLPPTFQRIVAGDALRIGARDFQVLSGDGHSPEQIMLWRPEENLFLAADQVLEKITPNVSVWAVDPDGDPLGLFIRSLNQLASLLPEEALVLPGHRLPFIGVRQRCRELIAHHEERCEAIESGARDGAKSVADFLPLIFPKVVDPHQMSFAFSEVFAHVNYMLRLGRLKWADETDGVERVIAA